MEIRYRRGARQNFMLLEGCGEDGFEARMLEGIKDRSLLSFRQELLEGRRVLCYDITALQPLRRVLRRRKLKREELRAFVLQLDHALSLLEENLLTEGSLLMDPEQIYVDPGTLRASFCAVPGGDFSFGEQLRSLFLLFLESISEEEAETVLLGHRLYLRSLAEEPGIGELVSLVLEARGLQGEELPAAGKACEEPGPGPAVVREAEAVSRREPVSPISPVSLPMPETIEPFGPSGKAAETETESSDPDSREDAAGHFRIQLLVSIVILLAAPVAVLFLRGTGAVFRMLPVFVVIDLSVILYLAVGFWEKRKGEKRLRDQNRPEDIAFFREKKEAPEEELRSYGKDAYGDNRGQLADQKDLFRQPETIPEDEGFSSTRQLLEIKEGNRERRLSPLNKALEEIRLTGFPFVIGKDSRFSDHVIRDERVSRMHLEIDHAGDQYFLTDLNSTNGTTVAGRRLNANERALLSPGDEISLGGVGYVFM